MSTFEHPYQKKFSHPVHIAAPRKETNGSRHTTYHEISIKDLAAMNVSYNKAFRVKAYARNLSSDTLDILKSKLVPFEDRYVYMKLGEEDSPSRYRVFGYRNKSANGIPPQYEGWVDATVYTRPYRVRDVNVVEIGDVRRFVA